MEKGLDRELQSTSVRAREAQERQTDPCVSLVSSLQSVVGNQAILDGLTNQRNGVASLVADSVALGVSGVDVQQYVPGQAPLSVMRAMLNAQREATRGADYVPGVGPLLARAQRSGGQPLPPAVRARMEQVFGHDFGHVRIHTDHSAAQAAEAVQARAFAQGNDIYFGRGSFAPDSREGQALLAHELAHVVQADEGRLPSPGGSELRVSNPGDLHEIEAERWAQIAVNLLQVMVGMPLPGASDPVWGWKLQPVQEPDTLAIIMADIERAVGGGDVVRPAEAAQAPPAEPAAAAPSADRAALMREAKAAPAKKADGEKGKDAKGEKEKPKKKGPVVIEGVIEFQPGKVESSGTVKLTGNLVKTMGAWTATVKKGASGKADVSGTRIRSMTLSKAKVDLLGHAGKLSGPFEGATYDGASVSGGGSLSIKQALELPATGNLSVKVHKGSTVTVKAANSAISEIKGTVKGTVFRDNEKLATGKVEEAVILPDQGHVSGSGELKLLGTLEQKGAGRYRYELGGDKSAPAAAMTLVESAITKASGKIQFQVYEGERVGYGLFQGTYEKEAGIVDATGELQTDRPLPFELPNIGKGTVAAGSAVVSVAQNQLQKASFGKIGFEFNTPSYSLLGGIVEGEADLEKKSVSVTAGVAVSDPITLGPDLLKVTLQAGSVEVKLAENKLEYLDVQGLGFDAKLNLPQGKSLELNKGKVEEGKVKGLGNVWEKLKGAASLLNKVRIPLGDAKFLELLSCKVGLDVSGDLPKLIDFSDLDFDFSMPLPNGPDLKIGSLIPTAKFEWEGGGLFSLGGRPTLSAPLPFELPKARVRVQPGEVGFDLQQNQLNSLGLKDATIEVDVEIKGNWLQTRGTLVDGGWDQEQGIRVNSKLGMASPLPIKDGARELTLQQGDVQVVYAGGKLSSVGIAGLSYGYRSEIGGKTAAVSGELETGSVDENLQVTLMGSAKLDGPLTLGEEGGARFTLAQDTEASLGVTKDVFDHLGLKQGAFDLVAGPFDVAGTVASGTVQPETGSVDLDASITLKDPVTVGPDMLRLTLNSGTMGVKVAESAVTEMVVDGLGFDAAVQLPSVSLGLEKGEVTTGKLDGLGDIVGSLKALASIVGNVAIPLPGKMNLELSGSGLDIDMMGKALQKLDLAGLKFGFNWKLPEGADLSLFGDLDTGCFSGSNKTFSLGATPTLRAPLDFELPQIQVGFAQGQVGFDMADESLNALALAGQAVTVKVKVKDEWLGVTGTLTNGGWTKEGGIAVDASLGISDAVTLTEAKRSLELRKGGVKVVYKDRQFQSAGIAGVEFGFTSTVGKAPAAVSGTVEEGKVEGAQSQITLQTGATLDAPVTLGSGLVQATLKQDSKIRLGVTADTFDHLGIQDAGYALKAGKLELDGTVSSGTVNPDSGEVDLQADASLQTPYTVGPEAAQATLEKGSLAVTVKKNDITKVSVGGVSASAVVKIPGVQEAVQLANGLVSSGELTDAAKVVKDLKAKADLGRKVAVKLGDRALDLISGRAGVEMGPKGLSRLLLSKLNFGYRADLSAGGKLDVGGSIADGSYDAGSGTFSLSANPSLKKPLEFGPADQRVTIAKGKLNLVIQSNKLNMVSVAGLTANADLTVLDKPLLLQGKLAGSYQEGKGVDIKTRLGFRKPFTLSWEGQSLTLNKGTAQIAFNDQGLQSVEPGGVGMTLVTTIGTEPSKLVGKVTDGLMAAKKGVERLKGGVTLDKKLTLGKGKIVTTLKKGGSAEAHVTNNSFEKLTIKKVGYAIKANLGGSKPLKVTGDLKSGSVDKAGKVNVTADATLRSGYTIKGDKGSLTLKSGGVKATLKDSALERLTMHKVAFSAKFGKYRFKGSIKEGGYKEGGFDLVAGIKPAGTLRVGRGILVKGGEATLGIKAGAFDKLALKGLKVDASPRKDVKISGEVSKGSYDGTNFEFDAKAKLARKLTLGGSKLKALFEPGAELQVKVAQNKLDKLVVANMAYRLKAGKGFELAGKVKSGGFENNAFNLETEASVESASTFRKGKLGITLVSGKVSASIQQNKLKTLDLKGLQVDAEYGKLKVGVDWSEGSFDGRTITGKGGAELKSDVELGKAGGAQVKLIGGKTAATVSIQQNKLEEVGGTLAAKVFDGGGEELLNAQGIAGTYKVADNKFSGTGTISLSKPRRIGDQTGVELKSGSGMTVTVTDNDVKNLQGSLGVGIFHKGEDIAEASLNIDKFDLSGPIPIFSGSATIAALTDIELLDKAVTVRAASSGFNAKVEENELVEFNAPGFQVEINKVKDDGGKPLLGSLSNLSYRRGVDWPMISFSGGSIPEFSLGGGRLKFGLDGLAMQDSSGFKGAGFGKFELNKLMGGDIGVTLDSADNWMPVVDFGLNFEKPMLPKRTWFAFGAAGKDGPYKLIDFKASPKVAGVPLNLAIGLEAGLEFGNEPFVMGANANATGVRFDPANPCLPNFDAAVSLQGGLFAKGYLGANVFLGVGQGGLAAAGVEAKVQAPATGSVAFQAQGKMVTEDKGFGVKLDMGMDASVALALKLTTHLKGVIGKSSFTSDPLTNNTYSLDDLFQFGSALAFEFGTLHGDSEPTAHIAPPGGAHETAARTQFEAEKAPAKPAQDLEQAPPGTNKADGFMKDMKHVQNIGSVVSEVFGYVGEVAALLDPLSWGDSAPGPVDLAQVSKGTLEKIVDKIMSLHGSIEKAKAEGSLSWLEEKLPRNWKIIVDLLETYLDAVEMATPGCSVASYLSNSEELRQWNYAHAVPMMRIQGIAQRMSKRQGGKDWATIEARAKAGEDGVDSVCKPSWDDVHGVLDSLAGFGGRQVGGQPWQHMEAEDWDKMLSHAIWWWGISDAKILANQILPGQVSDG